MSLLDDNLDIDINSLIISGLRQLLKDPDDDCYGLYIYESHKEYMSKKANSLSRFVGFKYWDNSKIEFIYPDNYTTDTKYLIGYDYLKIGNTPKIKFKLFPLDCKKDINTTFINVWDRDTSKEYIGNYKLCIGYRKLHPAISTTYTDYGYLQITINEIINGKLDLIHIR